MSVALKVGTVPTTALFEASLRVIVTLDVEVPLATTGVVPEIDEFAATAAPEVKTTVPPTLTTGVAIERVFVSAFVEVSVQVETPLTSLEEQADITFVELVSVAPKVGTTPDTPLLLAS